MLRYLAENMPSAIYFGLLFMGVGIEWAGWGASIAAVTVLSLARTGRMPWSPILLGINVHFALAAPLLTFVNLAVGREVVMHLLPYAEPTVLVVVFSTGLVLHCLNRGRFLYGSNVKAIVPGVPSAILLMISLFGVVWALWPVEGEPSGITGPLAALFLVRFAILHRSGWFFAGAHVATAWPFKPSTLFET